MCDRVLRDLKSPLKMAKGFCLNSLSLDFLFVSLLQSKTATLTKFCNYLPGFYLVVVLQSQNVSFTFCVKYFGGDKIFDIFASIQKSQICIYNFLTAIQILKITYVKNKAISEY